MAPKISALLSQVGIDVKHSPVIVTHHSEAVVFHRVGDSACIYPRGNLIPREWVVLKDSGDLEKRDAATTKYIGDFRHGTSLTIGQPFAGHSGSVTHSIEGLVINCRGGRKIKKDHGHFRSSYDRKDRGRQSVGRNV